MTPEYFSLNFSIIGLLFGLVFTVLFWAGVFAVGGAGWQLAEYLYRKSPAFRRISNTLKRIAVIETTKLDEKEAIDALKSQLSALDKFTWFSLTILGVALTATAKSISTLKIPGVEIPVEFFGVLFYILFLGSMLFYLRTIYSVEKIFEAASNKNAIKFQIGSYSGLVSPFAESASITGRVLDLLGFSILICLWWAAFEIGLRLTISSPLLNGTKLGSILPWVAVILGIWSLMGTKQVMEAVMTSKPLFVAKICLAVISLPCFCLVAHAFR